MQPVLQKIKNACPGTSVLMISTADKGFSYNGSWHTAKGLESLIDVQYNMAKNIGADFFNLYNAMGGEDAIVRHEGNLKPDRCRSHPTVRLMLLLTKAVPGPDTPCAERGICLDQVRPRPDDLRAGYLILQPAQPSGPHPASLAP